MRAATLETYSAAYDTLRTRHPRVAGNIFLHAARLAQMFNSKKCLLETTETSLFLLVPRHMFHDLLFLTADAASLPEALGTWLPDWPETAPLRVSVIGREPEAGAMAGEFETAGFSLVKKLLRMRLELPDEKLLQAMRPFAEEVRDLLGFAQPGDEAEILDILRESFDPMGDNLPELEEIRECINKRGIAVARKDGRILSLHYFGVQSGVHHSFYDVTRREYRGGTGFFMALAVFVHDELAARGIRCSRSLGWRDAARKKLLRHAQKSNQTPDGIVIYNMRWPAGAPALA